jgi:hypothetical protein
MQPVGLLEPRLELMLHGQRHLQREWGHRVDQHAPNRFIEAAAGHVLTDRFGAGDPAPLTHIGGPEGAVPLVIPHCHPIAALSAHDESWQERGSLPWGTPAAVAANRLRVLQEPALIGFELLPGDIAGMGVGNERRPFVARQPFDDDPCLGAPAVSTAAEKEGARRARIMYGLASNRTFNSPRGALMVEPGTMVTDRGN